MSNHEVGNVLLTLNVLLDGAHFIGYVFVRFFDQDYAQWRES
jgi:hypothetical protein